MQYGDADHLQIDSYRSEFCLELVVEGNPLLDPYCKFSTKFHQDHTKNDFEIGDTFPRIIPPRE